MDSKNLSRNEGGDVDLGALISKQISYVCNCFLSYSYSISIACTCIFTYLYYLHLYFYFHCTCYSSLASFILVGFSLSIKKAIKHLNSYLKEYRGEIIEPFIGNPASFLDFQLIVCTIHFNCCIFFISITPIHPF